MRIQAEHFAADIPDDLVPTEKDPSVQKALENYHSSRRTFAALYADWHTRACANIDAAGIKGGSFMMDSQAIKVFASEKPKPPPEPEKEAKEKKVDHEPDVDDKPVGGKAAAPDGGEG